MTDERTNTDDGVLPSAFMRGLRPEYYSDTVDRTTYQLDSSTFEYHLSTITARNQTQPFEIFCRKLCERVVCPNLRPATGPEGGGDSKTDTETMPVAEEITALTYIGSANAGRERWAFAFSAKKKWTDKVRKDVANITSTGRKYDRIFCVTSQFARAKNRARLEDELTKAHGIHVTILDRTWIVQKVIEEGRKDLACNYLGIGQEVADARLGPTDYSRKQQLEDIEKIFAEPEGFSGMEMQRVTEALVAARLSRNLERPRFETDGRFSRAIRLAEAGGSYRQKLEARYEWIWTGFWWFDDIHLLNEQYDTFELLALQTDVARNLELLCNLAQLLFNSVIHGHLNAEQAKLAQRIARLEERLTTISAQEDRPNNALEAHTSWLLLQVNRATVDRDRPTLTSLWPEFSKVVERAKGLGEFPAERLINIVEVFGKAAGNDPAYAQLIDAVAEFVAQRTSEAQGALVLLKRAQQLEINDRFEIIRLLGRATLQLSKKEYAKSFAEAMWLLSIAYRSAGLLWAARASCVFALASVFVEAEEDSQIPPTVVPLLFLLAWTTVELRHLPDAFEAIRLARGCVTQLPLDDASKKRAQDQLDQFDLVLGSQLLTLTTPELHQMSKIPDVLAGLGLFQSRTALLYALGHEPLLREQGLIPSSETATDVEDFFSKWASQPSADNFRNPTVINEAGPQIFVSTVLGIRIEVRHEGSEVGILVAEAVIGAVEALFATTVEVGAAPHAERFTISIELQETALASFRVDKERMNATILWPDTRMPASFGQQAETHKMLATLAGSIFTCCCVVDDMKSVLERFFESDAAFHRIAMVAVVGNSYHRLLNQYVSRLSSWRELAVEEFEPKHTRPRIVRRRLKKAKVNDTQANSPTAPILHDHRDLAVRSVIDVHLWDKASWCGTAYADWGNGRPPAMCLLFSNSDAARGIFERWRERFGKADERDEIHVAIIRGVSAENPHHYRVLITSGMTDDPEEEQLITVASRTNTMEPDSDTNLRRFLDVYGKVDTYWLMPAARKDDGQPDLMFDLAILKRRLVVKLASEVGDHDIEVMAISRPKQS